MRFALALLTLPLLAFGAEAQSSANGPTPPGLATTAPTDAPAPAATTPTTKHHAYNRHHNRHAVRHAMRAATPS